MEELPQDEFNELIKTFKNEDGSIAVDGRNLHEFLEVGKDFSTWFKDMTTYGFEEGTDFSPILGKSPNGGRPRIEYAITLDMAKELSMIQRTEKGKQARRYFIHMEKVANHLPQTPEEMVDLLLQNAGKSNKQIRKVEKRVTNLEENQTLSPGEYNYLSRRVNSAVAEYISVHHMQLSQKQRSKLFHDINSGLNEVTGVKTRSQLRAKSLDTAEEFIKNWAPSTATLTIIKQLGGETAGQTELDY